MPLLRGGEYFFRIYAGDQSFTDYYLRHSDLKVTIAADDEAAFYRFEGRDDGLGLLDHAPATLGLRVPTPGVPVVEARGDAPGPDETVDLPPTTVELDAMEDAVFMPGGSTVAEQTAAIAAHRRERAHRLEIAPYFPASVLDRWRATGHGWQARLAAWVAKGPA